MIFGILSSINNEMFEEKIADIHIKLKLLLKAHFSSVFIGKFYQQAKVLGTCSYSPSIPSYSQLPQGPNPILVHPCFTEIQIHKYTSATPPGVQSILQHDWLKICVKKVLLWNSALNNYCSNCFLSPPFLSNKLLTIGWFSKSRSRRKIHMTGYLLHILKPLSIYIGVDCL